MVYEVEEIVHMLVYIIDDTFSSGDETDEHGFCWDNVDFLEFGDSS